MSKLKKQKRINDCLRLLDNSFRNDFNKISVSAGNTLEHELAKFLVAYEYISEGKQILTESIFKGRGRADILIPEQFRAIEILHSETKEEALSKLDYYPSELDIVFQTSHEVLKRHNIEIREDD